MILDNRQAKGLTPERLKALADGRSVDAQTAVDAHMIDGIKYPPEVFERAKQVAGIKDAQVISYEYPSITGAIFTPKGRRPSRGMQKQGRAGAATSTCSSWTWAG